MTPSPMRIHGLPVSLSTRGVGPSHFDIMQVIRPNILALYPYRAARDDYQGGILLDANENPFGPALDLECKETAQTFLDDLMLHRYPDPAQISLKERIASLRSLPYPDHVILGVGSDEIIDLLILVFVAPGKEKILITPPTYGIYGVRAKIHDVEVVECPLELGSANGEGGEGGRFSVRVSEIKEAIDADPSLKIIFLCSPGNPTGTLIPLSTIRALLDYSKFKGIVVVDEAYIDFASNSASAVSLLEEYANFCVIHTFSKGFGLAGLRLGVGLAQPPLIQVLKNTKAAYNISAPTAQIAYAALSPASLLSMRNKIATIVGLRRLLLEDLSALVSDSLLGVGSVIGANDANFVLVPILDVNGKPNNLRAASLCRLLAGVHGVVVRFRGNEPGCEGCVRISVGTGEDNRLVVNRMREVLSVI